MVKNLQNTKVDAVILACTELSLVDNITSYDFVIDAMDILAYKSIIESGFELKS